MTLHNDEARLGRLLCVRLGGCLAGAVSLGLTGLVSGFPPPTFLDNPLAVARPHAMVLHNLGGLLRVLDASDHPSGEDAEALGVPPAPLVSLHELTSPTTPVS